MSKEHDLQIRGIDNRRAWAEGFPGQENYASVDDYIKEQLNKPPHVGDKKASLWHVVFITEKTYKKTDIAKWFNVPESRIRCLSDKLEIADSLKNLTNEDDFSRNMEKHLYSESEVHANFDFREYISGAVKLSGLCNQPWGLPGVVGGIGILYLALNFFATIKGKRENRFILGIPFIAGVHLLVAGLLSPCKWLALACVLDLTIWLFLYRAYTKV